MGRPSLQTTFEDEVGASRPSTAGGILDSMSQAQDRFGITLKLPERPKSATTIESPTATTPTAESPVRPRSQSKKRPFFWFDQRGSSRPQSATFFPTRSESSLVVTPPATPASPADDRSLDTEAVDENLLAVKNEDDKKPRKARSWAHSLLPLRSKIKTPTEEQASPFEQHQVSAPSTSNTEDFSMVAHFDADNTVDIVTSSIPTSPNYDASASADTASLPESPFGPDTMSPIIDLDAALGPFNTPSGSRSPHGLGSFSRRTLHSGSFGSGLQSLTQQHRRTESAPELAPFELRATLGNASTMADVFEEEEEQYYDSKKPIKATSMSPIVARSANSDGPRLQMPRPAGKRQEGGEDWPLRAGLGISDSSDTGNMESADAPNSSASVAAEELPSDEPALDSAACVRDDSPVEVVEDYEEPRASSLTKDSDSTVTPTLSDDESKQRPPLMKLNLPLAPPAIMTPDTISSSPLSTPDYYRGGRPSSDTPRVGTASSSMTDNRTVNSYLMGEAGMEYRISVDDVPSLSSSRSTMTSPPQHHQQHPLATVRTSQYGGGSSSMLQHDARSGSVSSIPSAGAERTRKRASIASLSRLVAGSFAEKSKLSIESRPQTSSSSAASSAFAGAGGEEGGRKKRNRISRLMTFWKSKEQLTG